MDNRHSKVSELMNNACKNISNIIGYEKMILLKEWKKAFPKKYHDCVYFDKLQMHRKDSTVIITFRVSMQPMLLLLFYDKLIIKEKLNNLLGFDVVSDIRFVTQNIVPISDTIDKLR